MTFSINPTAQKTQAMFQQMAIAQNGTGSASPITGGSAVAPPPAAATTAVVAAPAQASGIASGTGSMNNGACECSCLCGMAAFPNAAVQGLGGYGGMSGQYY
jgi:hypothetical protein